MRKIKSLGMEIELAVYHKGEPTVCYFLTHTKRNPLNIKGHLVHKDASMLEIAMPPAKSGAELDQIQFDAIKHARSVLPRDVVLDANPAVHYSTEELDRDPYASVLGCGASQNIYGNKPMPDAYTDNYRYGGMHVNIGMEKDSVIEDVLRLDYALGLQSVINWEQGFRDSVIRRRKTYGRAGEYRTKPFGIEYRTLPNCAQMSGMWLWRTVEAALNIPDAPLLHMSEHIEAAINECDRGAAEELLGEGLLNV